MTMGLSRIRYIVGGLVVAVALGLILFLGLRGCAVESYTVSELIRDSESVYGETIRVEGEVEPGTLVTNEEARWISFVLRDENGVDRVPVVYEGVVPESFREGRGVSIDGELLPEGVFAASEIFTRCASKYVPGD